MTDAPGVAISLTAKLPDARLDALARDLARDLGRTGAVRAAPAEAPTQPGERGVAAAIGEILLEAAGGAGAKLAAEAAKAVADVLKAYLVRERSLKIVITRPDGSRLEIDAKNMKVDAIAAALASAGLARA